MDLTIFIYVGALSLETFDNNLIQFEIFGTILQ